MLRFRDSEGKVLDIDAEFVEILDSDGLVGAALHTTKQGVNMITKDSPEAKDYSRVFKIKFCPLLSHEGEIS